ncbi:hypothetical protein BKA67DRAFT_581607 [Truncatella angustata]|uniref:Secreted protein n=1 Tax=Truncatella angustata TaxID=152316 RepID=A0A9P8RP65_9PEZI|nr:uncharacterized protein BKA67DRAFT_581607 [Truncatella angustata]KAH6647085.1 hypothetical protein BKA67DRAFT_581607 [Truncatella angustata]
MILSYKFGELLVVYILCTSCSFSRVQDGNRAWTIERGCNVPVTLCSGRRRDSMRCVTHTDYVRPIATRLRQ